MSNSDRYYYTRRKILKLPKIQKKWMSNQDSTKNWCTDGVSVLCFFWNTSRVPHKIWSLGRRKRNWDPWRNNQIGSDCADGYTVTILDDDHKSFVIMNSINLYFYEKSILSGEYFDYICTMCMECSNFNLKSLISVVFLTVTLGLASLAIILTILIIQLYHKPKHYIAPKWIHKIIECLKSKGCRGNSIKDHIIYTDEKAESSKDKNSNLKANSFLSIADSTQPSNKQLAEFLDKVLFLIFTVIYIVVVLCFTVTLCVSEWQN